MLKRGIIAAGHELTARSGAEILRAGGNAFDAAVAASRVVHPHLVDVYDAIDEGARAYVVREWVDGSSLRELVADAPLEADRATTVTAAVASAAAAVSTLVTGLPCPVRSAARAWVPPGLTSRGSSGPVAGGLACSRAITVPPSRMRPTRTAGARQRRHAPAALAQPAGPGTAFMRPGHPPWPASAAPLLPGSPAGRLP